jgi:ClpP class serine protease
MPKHSLLRLASKIHNVPHLITPQAFNVVLDYLDTRNGGIKMMMPETQPDNDQEDSSEDSSEDGVDGLKVINIDGSLTYMPLMTMCGEVGTSYSSLSDQVEDAIEQGCTTILFNVTSGGGEASHVFQCAEDIRNMCDEAGVKLIAYADTMACSAAYALSVIADTVIVNPSAIVGSIGCVVALLDTSKAMEQAGLKRIFVTSGDAKVPYDETGAFKQDFLDSIQKDVDSLNMEFSEFVSKYTGIEAEVIRGMQANTFTAQEAVNNGLANQVMTNKQFAAWVAGIHQGASYA